MSDGVDDYLDDSDREWLRKSRQSAARRSWLLIAVLVVVAIILAWLTVDGRLPGFGRSATPTTTADQRAIADGQRALADWGRFAVTNDLRTVKDSFWTNGPQYKQLAKEAKERRGKPIGPPPYQMTMSDVQVLRPREDQRVLRGRVRMTRPGEVPQAFNWDVWLQVDPAAGGRWRLWTVRTTAGT
jgi:hypothetical protein